MKNMYIPFSYGYKDVNFEMGWIRHNFAKYWHLFSIELLLKVWLVEKRGGGPPVISHKCRLISWLILAPRPPMHFLHKTFPGTSDKISGCAKFHGSSCLISWLPKSDLCETTEHSPPLYHYKQNLYLQCVEY